MLISWLADQLDSSGEFKVTPFKTSGGRNLGEGVFVSVAGALVIGGKAAL